MREYFANTPSYSILLKKPEYFEHVQILTGGYGVVNSTEAAELLGCSRQNITDLIRRGKLHPLKSSDKNTLYLKSEVIQRNWH